MEEGGNVAFIGLCPLAEEVWGIPTCLGGVWPWDRVGTDHNVSKKDPACATTLGQKRQLGQSSPVHQERY